MYAVGKEMPISRIVVVVPNATVVLLDKLIEVRKDLVCCLLVTCLLHLGATFLVRVRFFEHPSFIRVTSPNTLLWCLPFSLDGTKIYIVPLLGLSSLRLDCMSIQLIDLRYGFTWSWILCRNHSHDLVSELPEQSTLQGFGHEVSDHVSSRTPDQ
jgi:hypothetical protein